jgi:hypothetical protein
MNQLISDLFDISLGKSLQSKATCIHVKSWFDEMEQFYRISIEAKGLTFNVAIDSDVQNLEFDGLQLRQCVGNLIDNAMKYTDNGFVSLKASAYIPVAGSRDLLPINSLLGSLCLHSLASFVPNCPRVSPPIAVRHSIETPRVSWKPIGLG